MQNLKGLAPTTIIGTLFSRPSALRTGEKKHGKEEDGQIGCDAVIIVFIFLLGCEPEDKNSRTD